MVFSSWGSSCRKIVVSGLFDFFPSNKSPQPERTSWSSLPRFPSRIHWSSDLLLLRVCGRQWSNQYLLDVRLQVGGRNPVVKDLLQRLLGVESHSLEVDFARVSKVVLSWPAILKPIPPLHQWTSSRQRMPPLLTQSNMLGSAPAFRISL